MTTEKPTGLALMREPFPANQISKLPKPTKAQTDAVKADFKAGVRCEVCGAWHHKDVVHLDYVGHAALTDRLLDADTAWHWQPLAFANGLPSFDQSGGLWIKLSVCGIERLGYGHAAARLGQDPGAREKEVIGDALRNAAMRFGAALDLWHKGDLHIDEDPVEAPKQEPQRQAPKRDAGPTAAQVAAGSLANADTLDQLAAIWGDIPKSVKVEVSVIEAKDKRKGELTPKPATDLGDDEIPY